MEELQSCQDISSSRSEEIRKDIEKLQNSYFSAEQYWEYITERFKSQALQRALQLWRSEPHWYLHEALVSDCIKRGGCCGRACGCCRDRELASTKKLAAGHCTVECHCCQEFRGFALSSEKKQHVQGLHQLGPEKNPLYFKRMMMVSVFGLVEGSTANPFDLIDRPPGYDKSDAV